MDRHPIVSILALTGGAYAVWWLWSKKYKNVGAEVPFVASFESIVRRRSDSIPEVLCDLAGSYGCVYSICLENSRIVVVNSREMIELVGIARAVGLCAEHPKYASRINEAHSYVYPDRKCFLAAHELKDQCRRAIKCYGCEDHLVGANILIEVDKLVEVFRAHESSEKQFDAYEYVNLACTNVLCSLMFGCRYKYKSRRLRAFTEVILFNLCSKNVFSSLESGRTCSKKLIEQLKRPNRSDENVVENLKKILYFIDFEVESHKKDFLISKYRDFVDIYLRSLCVNDKSKNSISAISFESTIADIFTFGVHPVSAHIMWAIYCMVEYPDVQTKCHEEIDEKVGHSRPVTLEDSKSLVYVCSTLNEVMRRFTILPLGLPLVARRTFKLGPFEVAENSTIVCNYHSAHMDSDVWPDPVTFKPERFSSFQEDRICKKLFNYGSSSSYTSCPASCLSSKIVFIIFANLLQNFDFERNNPPVARETSKCPYNVIRHPPRFSVKIDSH